MSGDDILRCIPNSRHHVRAYVTVRQGKLNIILPEEGEPMSDKCSKCGAGIQSIHVTSSHRERAIYICGRDAGGPPTVPCLERQLAQEKAEIKKLRDRLKAYEAAVDRECDAIDKLQQIEMDKSRQSNYSRAARRRRNP